MDKIKITKHAKEEYIRRIQGVTNKKEIARVLNCEEDRVEKSISRLFEYSDYIYSGQLGGRNTNAEYYLNGTTALVVGNEGQIITLYDIDFPFPEDAVKSVIDSLVREIEEGQRLIDETSEELREERDEIDLEIEKREATIKTLEAEIEIEKGEIDALKSRRSVVLNRNIANQSRVDEYAKQLFSNTSLKVLK